MNEDETIFKQLDNIFIKNPINSTKITVTPYRHKKNRKIYIALQSGKTYIIFGYDKKKKLESRMESILVNDNYNFFQENKMHIDSLVKRNVIDFVSIDALKLFPMLFSRINKNEVQAKFFKCLTDKLDSL